MKKTLTTIGLIAFSIHCAAASAIRDAQKDTLTCNEKLTGADVQLKVETVYTTVEFDGGSSTGGATKRTIELVVRGKKAVSVLEAPSIPKDISWEQVGHFPFLNDTYKGSDGAEYRYEQTFYDAQKKQYPAELLRLAALIPLAERTTKWGQTVSGFNINMILPEVRLQENTFQASGYVGYKLAEDKNGDDLTIGLAALECSRTRENLLQTRPLCKSAKDEARIVEIEQAYASAKAARPGCEHMWGAAACLDPATNAELRYLRSKTMKCQE